MPILNWNMFELKKSLLNVTFHATAQLTGTVVPFHVNANVLFSVKVNLESILELHNFDKVLDVLFADVFDAKVIDDKGESNVTSLVFDSRYQQGCADYNAVGCVGVPY